MQVRKGIALPIGDEDWLKPEMLAQLSLTGLRQVRGACWAACCGVLGWVAQARDAGPAVADGAAPGVLGMLRMAISAYCSTAACLAGPSVLRCSGGCSGG